MLFKVLADDFSFPANDWKDRFKDFSEKMRTLFIGEDSSTHVNSYLWAYNVDTKELARLGDEVAGAYRRSCCR